MRETALNNCVFMQIFLSRKGQRQGPYTVQTIQSMLRIGTAKATDLAWYEGAADWMPLTQVPGITMAAPPKPQPAAPPIVPMAKPLPLSAMPMPRSAPTEASTPKEAVPPPAQPQPAAPPPSSPGQPAKPVPYGYAQVRPRETSPMAITSMVLGILAIFTLGLTGIPAIICGHVARSQIRGGRGWLKGKGFALTGLVIGYPMTAFLGLIALGLAMSPISFGDRMRVTHCLEQAHEIGIACKKYADEHNGNYPAKLEDLVPLYLPDAQTLVSPLDDTKAPDGYTYYGGNENETPKKPLLVSKPTKNGLGVVVYSDLSTERIGSR